MAIKFDPVTGLPYDDAQADSTLAAGAVEAEGAEVPFEQQLEINPFKYTEQALNPRAEAVMGMSQRDPRARSAAPIPGLGQARPSWDTMYQNSLPMVDRTIALGDVSQYQNLEGYKDIANPTSVYGRSQIAALPGFEGKSQNTLLFDMPTIGKGMGWSDEKTEKMMNYRGPGGGLSGGLSMDAIKGAVGGADFTGTTNAKGANFTGVGGMGKERPWGKSLGDEEKIFYGLMSMSSKPGGKAGRVEGEENYRGREGVDYGRQKKLDLDLDDPRHMTALMEMGESYARTGGRGLKGDVSAGDFFRYQRGFDRDFRKAGRISGGFWEGMKEPENISKMAAIALAAVATGGALGPALAAFAAPALGLAGAGGVGVAAGLGGSLLTGASMGLVGGATAGFAQSAMSGFEGGVGGTLKNIGMGAGLGAIGGGVMGGLGHAGSLAMGGSGFGGIGGGSTGLSFQAPGTAGRAMLNSSQAGQLGLSGFAGGTQVPLAQMMNISKPVNYQINPSTGMYEAQGVAGGVGGAGSAAAGDESGLRSVFAKAQDVISSPGTKAIGKGIMSGAEAAQAQEARMEQMLAQGTGLVSGAQGGALGIGGAGSATLGGQFRKGLPDDPYYNRANYDDFESEGQGSYV